MSEVAKSGGRAVTTAAAAQGRDRLVVCAENRSAFKRYCFSYQITHKVFVKAFDSARQQYQIAIMEDALACIVAEERRIFAGHPVKAFQYGTAGFRER